VLAPAMETWHEHAHAQAGILTRIAARWVLRDISAAYFTWKRAASKERRAKRISARTLSNWLHRTAAGTFESWHVHAKKQRRIRDVCSRILIHMLHVELATAWETWKDRAKSQARAEGICQRVLGHMSRRCAAFAFGICLPLLEQKNMEQVCTHMMKKMLHHSLDVVMITWKDHARKLRRASVVCARVVGHLLHHAAAAAFESFPCTGAPSC
jgi:hypothetical protein